MKYEVIGIRTLIENQQSHENGSAEMTQYKIILKDEQGNLCSFTAKNTYGDCGSGWTSATWGSFTEVTPLENIGTLHYVPRYKMFGEFTGPSTVNEDEFTEVGTGKLLVGSSEDGGCNYYPSGSCEVELSLFTKTPRAVEKRKVFILTGPSCIGKSFLASNCSLPSYETDRSLELPDNLEEFSIIVVGNKHKHTLEQIGAHLKDASVDLVHVALSALA